jgi:hypothetical protein
MLCQVPAAKLETAHGIILRRKNCGAYGIPTAKAEHHAARIGERIRMSRQRCSMGADAHTLVAWKKTHTLVAWKKTHTLVTWKKTHTLVTWKKITAIPDQGPTLRDQI